jgi:hypothetical protein
MATKTGSLSVYDASASSGVGKHNRESLGDAIWDVSPTETPVASALPKIKAKAVYHEWLTDSLAAAANTASIEGEDADLTAASVKTRVGNRTQIFEKAVAVTGTQQAVDKAGVDDELAREVAKAMKELKRNIETALLDNNIQVAGDESTARELAGFPAYIATAFSVGATGSAGASGTTAAVRGTSRTFSETLFTGVQGTCWTNGGNPTMAVMAGSIKEAFRSLSGIGNQTRYSEAESKKIVAGVDVYVGTYGTVKLVADRYINALDVLLIDPEYAAIAVLRPMDSWRLAKVGDNESEQVLTELTLEVRNEKAHGYLTAVTAS